MTQIAERLTEKIQTLTEPQLAEVERFVESLQTWEEDVSLARAAFKLSQPTLSRIWDNPEDDVYNALGRRISLEVWRYCAA